jgi:hypothetical protein
LDAGRAGDFCAPDILLAVIKAEHKLCILINKSVLLAVVQAEILPVGKALVT